MKIEKTPDDRPPGLCISVSFKDDIYEYMEEWYKVYSKIRSELEIATSEEEKKEILTSYRDWEWTYPQGIIDKTEKDLQKARIKKKIEELQEAYDQLDQGDGE